MDEGTLKSYIAGFVSSIVLTLAAFFVVMHPGFLNLGSVGILTVILVLAVVQLIVQLLFFLHLGSGKAGRWRMGIFISTIALVLLIVIGSLWIMNHLNYNMMANPQQMQQYINDQQGF